ncbi:hypothetical protein [Solibacillus sp. CAU 1738]|uniref:hypothetical protein n=1 Tax=Solibacillus sp. CAU 1738 TaxID=3140363 RepID=UPI00326007AF
MLIKNCNSDKLFQDLLDANNNVISAIEDVDGDVFTFVDGTDIGIEQWIINARDPAPIPQEESELEILRDNILEMEFRMIMKELEV